MKSAIAIALGLATTAHADINLSSLDAEPNRVHVTTGAEYGLVAGAGYTRILPFLDRKLVLTGDATVPWAGADLMDYKVRVRALVPIAGTTHWKLAAAIAPIVRGTKNGMSRMENVGVDIGVVGGYYTNRWFAAADSGFDAQLATHVTHDDAYRELVYMNAKDGWYSNTGGNLRGGLQAGVRIDRYDISLRAGKVVDASGEAPMLPIYANLTFDARW